MKLHEVTNADGQTAAHLLNFLKTGRWDLSGEQAEHLTTVRKWVAALAVEMASQLKSKPVQVDSPASPNGSDTAFRVKAMGSIGGTPSSVKQTKKSKK